MPVKDFIKTKSKKDKSEISMQKGIFDTERLKKDDFLWITFILTATLIFYFPTFKNKLVDWDDNIYILNNPYIFSLGITNIKNIFSSFFNANYHPLTMLSYAIEYAISGESPLLYHSTNAVLHLLNTALVYIFVRRLFSMLDQTDLKKQNLIIPVISAFLFGLHPLHVESVSWVSERKDVLYTFFFLLAIIKYLQYLSTKRSKYYAITIFLFLLSLLSKGMAVSFSVCIVAIDFVLTRDLFSRKVIVEKIPFFALSMIFGIAAILAQKSGYAIMEKFQFWDKISFASYALVQYVAKLIAPFKLSHFYPYPHQVEGQIPLFYYYNIILLLGSAAVIYLIRKSRILIFGLLFFMLNIVLVLRLIPLGNTIMADRYTYLSSVGIFVMIAFLINHLINSYPQFRKLILSVFVVYISILGYKTYERTLVWRDSFSLWDDAAKKYPDNPIVVLNRGIAIEKNGNADLALIEYRRSEKLDPSFDMPHTNIGNIKLSEGDKVGAIEEFSKAITMNSNNLDAIYNRGRVLIDLGEFNKAIIDLNDAIKIDPNFSSAYHNRGVAKYYLKNYTEAIVDFNSAIRLNPKAGKAYFMLGIVYTDINNRESACANFQKAYSLNVEKAGAYLEKYCK